MTRTTVDDALRTPLHNLTVPLELCDGSGRVLARVVPHLDPGECVLEPPRDEWERRLRSAATDCGVSLSDEAVSSEGLNE